MDAQAQGPFGGNWLAISREIRFHPIVGFLKPDGTPKDGVTVNESNAWIDLLCEANWRDREVNNAGKVMLIERGQLMAARAWLSRRWGWSEDKVRWYLKKLENAGMITPAKTQNHTQSNTQKKAHFANVITICNYKLYQTLRELEGLLNTQPNTQSTPNQHPHHNKETILEVTNVTSGSRAPELALDGAPRLTASVAARAAFEMYNETAKACGLPIARKLDKTRAAALAHRVKEAGGLDGFRQAMANIEKSAFLRGMTEQGFRADLTFVCQAKSFTRLLEGSYGNGAHAGAKTSYSRNGVYAGATL